MNKILRNISYILSTLIVLFVVVQKAQADEVQIRANGAASTSNAIASSTTQNNVTQTNNSQVNNSVTTNTTTGNNSANNNTGGSTAISSGNSTANTTINNSANSASTTLSCCSTGTGTTEKITANGSDSQNSTGATTNSQSTVTINNNFTGVTAIQENLNTGGNSANNNSGSVSIVTGAIKNTITVMSGPVNSASVSVPDTTGSGTAIKVAGNGEGSQNTASATVDTSNQVTVTSRSNITNDVQGSFTTGNNSANNNFGTVDIATGDVISETRLVNGPINVTGSDVVCCNQFAQIPPNQNSSPNLPTTNTNQPATAPTTTTVSSSSTTSPSPSSSGGGGVLGISTANLLPVTGNNWFFFAMIANVVMLFLGSYLRLHSGRAPNFAYSFH